MKPPGQGSCWASRTRGANTLRREDSWKPKSFSFQWLGFLSGSLYLLGIWFLDGLGHFCALPHGTATSTTVLTPFHRSLLNICYVPGTALEGRASVLVEWGTGETDNKQINK